MSTISEIPDRHPVSLAMNLLFYSEQHTANMTQRNDKGALHKNE